METWRPVVDYEGYYEVSNYGNIRSLLRNVTHSRNKNFTRRAMPCLLSINDNGSGYKLVYLYKNNSKKVAHKVHRLVAQAFLPNIHNLPIVDHIDHNKANNHVNNLRWVTQEDNVAYRNKPVEMVDVDGKVICVCKSANWVRKVLGIRADYVLYGGKESLNGIKFRFQL